MAATDEQTTAPATSALGVGCWMFDVGCSRAPRARRAFTLLEVLVVISIITIFIGVIGFSLRGGGSPTVGLQASQSILVGLLTQARTQAALSGRDARLYVHFDPDPDKAPDRFLRFLIVAVQTPDGSQWEPVDAGTYLPRGCCVVPDPAPAAPLVDNPTAWTNLRSRVLRESDVVSESLESLTPQDWLYLKISPQGTVQSGGSLVVARCEDQLPGSAFPIKLVDPQNIRGLVITRYGQFRLVANALALSTYE